MADVMEATTTNTTVRTAAASLAVIAAAVLVTRALASTSTLSSTTPARSSKRTRRKDANRTKNHKRGIKDNQSPFSTRFCGRLIPLQTAHSFRLSFLCSLDKDTPQYVTGLVNSGNTCFMNAVLQVRSDTRTTLATIGGQGIARQLCVGVVFWYHLTRPDSVQRLSS